MTALSEDQVRAVVDTYASGWLTQGPRTVEFEAALAVACGVPHAVAVTSTTAALHLALRAVGVTPDAEVLVAANAHPAVLAAVRLCGARPVVVPSRSPLDPPDGPAAERSAGERTAALVAGHPLGFAHDLDELRAWCDAHGLPLVEDATEALGARTPAGAVCGGMGDVAVVSLASGGPVDVGTGGAVLTASATHRDAIASWRSHAMTSGTWERHHGRQASYDIVDVGYNYRFDEPRAVLGLGALSTLAEQLPHRRGVAERYRARLDATAGVQVLVGEADVARSAPTGVPVRLDLMGSEGSVALADAITRHLADEGVGAVVTSAAPDLVVLPLDVPPAVADAVAATIRELVSRAPARPTTS